MYSYGICVVVSDSNNADLAAGLLQLDVHHLATRVWGVDLLTMIPVRSWTR